MIDMSKPTLPRPDITRRYVHRSRNGKTFLHARFEPAFKAYAAERVHEEDPNVREDPDRGGFAVIVSPEVLQEISRRLDVAPKVLSGWVYDDLQPDRRGGIWCQPLPVLTDEQYEAFARWERDRAHRSELEPLREFAAYVAEPPIASRTGIEETYAALDDVGRAAMRPSLNAYLMAAELADEVRRLLAVAHQTAVAVYERRSEEVAA